MKNFKKNMFGFAHHAVLGLVVIGIISVAGVRVLTGTHALTPVSSTESDSASSGASSSFKITVDQLVTGGDSHKKTLSSGEKVAVASAKLGSYIMFDPNLKNAAFLKFATHKGQLYWVCYSVRVPQGTAYLSISNIVWQTNEDGGLVSGVVNKKIQAGSSFHPICTARETQTMPVTEGTNVLPPQVVNGYDSNGNVIQSNLAYIKGMTVYRKDISQ